jgi:hypothetical protein
MRTASPDSDPNDEIIREYVEPVKDEPASPRRWGSLEPATPQAIPSDSDSDRDELDDHPIPDATISGQPIIPPNARQWFVNAFRHLTTVDFGPSFHVVLRHFIAVKKEQNYQYSRYRFGKNGRPIHLQKWIERGRWKVKKLPGIDDPVTFGGQWWTWWLGIQPEWRVQIQGQRPPRGEYGDNWRNFIAPGPNGWLSVVASLYWWGCSIQNSPHHPSRRDFDDAVADITYMLNGFHEFISQGKEEKQEDTE